MKQTGKWNFWILYLFSSGNCSLSHSHSPQRGVLTFFSMGIVLSVLTTIGQCIKTVLIGNIYTGICFGVLAGCSILGVGFECYDRYVKYKCSIRYKTHFIAELCPGKGNCPRKGKHAHHHVRVHHGPRGCDHFRKNAQGSHRSACGYWRLFHRPLHCPAEIVETKLLKNFIITHLASLRWQAGISNLTTHHGTRFRTQAQT